MPEEIKETQEIKENTSTAVIDNETAIQADIEKMKTAMADMKEKSEDLFAEEIKNLETKIANAEAELAAETTRVIDETKIEVTTWWDKHKADVYNVLKIGSLVYIAIRLTM